VDCGDIRERQPAAETMKGPNVPLARTCDVLTDTHWTFGPKREGPTEVAESAEWRIETFEFEPWVRIEVAVRYLTQLHESSTSELVRRNVHGSIAKLRHVLGSEGRGGQPGQPGKN
jgi:hypothetical protein